MFDISIINNKDPLIQLNQTSKTIGNNIEQNLNEMKGLKFIETLIIEFEKPKDEDKDDYQKAQQQISRIDSAIKSAFERLFKNDDSEKITKKSYLNIEAQSLDDWKNNKKGLF